MKKGIILILVLCMVLLTGCSDIKPKEALDETPSASVTSDTTVTKENESINNYKYYDVNLINIIDWTTETGAITVPTKIRTNGVTYRYVYNDNGERIAKYIGNDNRVDYTYEQPASGARSVLKSEKNNNYSVEYVYDDVDGIYHLTGLRYNDKDYTYIKDDNGNIIGIKDSAGNTVAEYSYTSKEFTTEVTTTNYTDVNIGDINSMLYENSYYDRETGFCCDYVYTNYIDGTPYQIKMFY